MTDRQSSNVDYHLVFESIPEPALFVLADAPSYRVGAASDGFLSIFGLERRKIQGQPVCSVLACLRSEGDESEALYSHIANVLAHAVAGKGTSEQIWESRFEARLNRWDGIDVIVIVSVAPVAHPDGGAAGAVLTFSDITARKESEIHLGRLAAIVASSEDAIVSKDLTGIVTSWNASAERIYGWKAEEIIGRSKSLVMPDDLPNELTNILAKVHAGERIEHYETRRKRKDGTIFDVAISVSPVRDGAGNLIGAATIARDITERKQADRELRRRQEEVEQLNERLKWAMQETHHRVKNNLQIVSAMIDMQMLDDPSEETVPLAELRRIGNHIRTLAMVHDMLTVRLRENEEDQLVSSKFVFAQLVGLLQQTSAGREIRSHVEDVPLRSKQAVSLALVVNELVSNALKHSSESVAIELYRCDDKGVLAISDHGPGFPAGFDLALHANTGMELVQALTLTDLAGTLALENRPDGGATVKVEFTLPPPVAEAKPSLPPPS